MGSLADELLEKIKSLGTDEREELEKQKREGLGDLLWIPSSGPQTDAYFSLADVLLYGGEAGGGKSDLLLGLAFNEHRKSLIMRRQYTELSALTERAIEINGTRRGYSGSSPPKLITRNGRRRIDFGAALVVGDEKSWQGRPHDFLGLDEGVHFTRDQIRFLMGWIRSVVEGQRKRCVIATNPPIDEDGQYIVEMFAPWLDPQHPNPAIPGELRWYVSDEYGEDMEVEGPEPMMVGQELVKPLSRTFIPASVEDNPYLANTDYKQQLDAMPEPYRSAFRDGNFMIARKDDLKQVIPTEWVRDAQRRWSSQPPVGVPMCAIGVDVARGGPDNTVLAPRFDSWFAELIKTPGTKTPLGTDVAGLVVAHRRDEATIIIDMGGGWGGEPYGCLIANGIENVVAYMGVNPTNERTKDGKIGFVNVRSLAIWRFREALDPTQPGGSPIALPRDARVLADLTAPRFTITPRGIAVESKEDLVKRLKRSTDDGDAIVMAWTDGAKVAMQQGGWAEHGRNRRPKVNTGNFAPRGRKVG